MGYESSLHLIDVKIKPASTALVARALKGAGRGLVRVGYFLENVVVNQGGFLAFKATEGGFDPYTPNEDGTVPTLSGEWIEAERVARWLRRHSEKGGRIVLHSNEADGKAWGWEFDGAGRMRQLALVPVGNWS